MNRKTNIALLNPYTITRTGLFSFEFATDNFVKYKIYFMECGWLFENNLLMEHFVYTFNITVKEGNPKESRADPRVACSICDVFRQFFSEKWVAVVYICDSSDSRELTRKRIFDRWFHKFNDGMFAKVEYEAICEGETIYNSMVIRADNPLWADYLIMHHKANNSIGLTKEGRSR